MNYSQEVFNLLNPAFCGQILLNCIESYRKSCKREFPFSLAYLVLPLVLPSKIRENINPKSQELLHTWVFSNQILLLDFPTRTKELLSLTNETIMFLLQSKTIELDSFANIILKTEIKKSKPMNFNDENIEDELSDGVKKSRVIGRWFAKIDNTSKIFAILGVSP